MYNYLETINAESFKNVHDLGLVLNKSNYKPLKEIGEFLIS